LRREDQCLIIVLLVILVLVLSSCQLETPINITLTEEERQLLLEHSFYSPKVARWRDGAIIKVYDSTNFLYLDYVLSEWNKVFEGKIFLVKTENSFEANIVIYFEDLEGDLGGLATTYYEEPGRIYKGEIKIDPIKGGYPALYLHELGHVLGCHGHLKEGLMHSPIMGEEIDEYTKYYFQLLYSLPIGWDLSRKGALAPFQFLK